MTETEVHEEATGHKHTQVIHLWSHSTQRIQFPVSSDTYTVYYHIYFYNLVNIIRTELV